MDCIPILQYIKSSLHSSQHEVGGYNVIISHKRRQAQRGSRTYLKTHSWQVVEVGLKPSSEWPHILSSSGCAASGPYGLDAK